jgi:hypothetical protein
MRQDDDEPKSRGDDDELLKITDPEVIDVARKMGLAKVASRRYWVRRGDAAALNEAVQRRRIAAGRDSAVVAEAARALAVERWQLDHLQVQLAAALIAATPPPAKKRPPEPRYDGDILCEDGYGYAEWVVDWSAHLARLLRRLQ